MLKLLAIVCILLSIKQLNDYWETNMDTQRFGRLVAEEMFIEMYGRLLGFYCDTAEQRYIITALPKSTAVYYSKGNSIFSWGDT